MVLFGSGGDFHMYWLEVQVKWEGDGGVIWERERLSHVLVRGSGEVGKEKVVLFGRDFHMFWLEVQVKWEGERWCYLGEGETFTCIS